MNRFFFRCSQCLFKFTADLEGVRPPQVEGCPVCRHQWVSCFGATKGVLRWDVPCNDKCVFAEGPDCSCSCGGKNHGSRLLVPVLGRVVDFKGKLPSVERARAVWVSFDSRRSAALKLAEGLGVSGRFLSGMEGVTRSQSWDNREKLFKKLLGSLGISPPPPVFGAAVGLVAVASVFQSAPGELQLF